MCLVSAHFENNDKYKSSYLTGALSHRPMNDSFSFLVLSADIWEPAAGRDGLDHALLRGLLDVRSRQRRHLRIVKIVLRGGQKRPHA